MVRWTTEPALHSVANRSAYPLDIAVKTLQPHKSCVMKALSLCIAAERGTLPLGIEATRGLNPQTGEPRVL